MTKHPNPKEIRKPNAQPVAMASGFVIRASFVLGSLGISSLKHAYRATIGQSVFGINVPSEMLCAQ
jgi:hypothetical protein